MSPFASIHRMLTWSCIHPNEDTASEWRGNLSIAFGVIVFLSELWVVISCAYLFGKHVSMDLEASLYPLFQFFGHIVAFYGFVYLVYVREKSHWYFHKVINDFRNKWVVPFNIIKRKQIKMSYFLVILFNYSFETDFNALEPDADKDSFRFLRSVDNASERLSQRFVKYSYGSFGVSVAATSLISVLFSFYVSGNFDGRYLYRSYKLE